jgi:hypothetical protein
MARTELFRLRLTPTELEDWHEAASHAGLTLSAYVRETVAAQIQLERVLQAEKVEREREAEARHRAARELARTGGYRLPATTP